MILSRAVLVAAALTLLSCPPARATAQTAGGQTGKPDFSTQTQLQEDIAAAPCKGNSERLKAVRALFEKMGARPSDISVEKLKDVENVTVLKRGSTPELIVVGAHYDKVSHGCGAVDNWTGVVTMAHLYKTIKDLPLKKSVLFVGFGREEEGLVGSKAMVKGIGKEQRARYCAMLNIDSLGLAVPQAESRISSGKLVARAADLAGRMKMPFQQGTVSGADSDSSSFLDGKIPAITIHGLSSNWRKVLHTNGDSVSKVNALSVFMGYTLTLALLGEVEDSACDAFR